jgi:hypothetical protein
MTARSLARLQAAGRLTLGGGLAVAPGRFAGAWVGGVADKRDGQVLSIGLGARDVAIALGTLRALQRGRGAAAWLRARDDLPPLAVPAVAAIAGGSVLLGAYLQSALD